MTERLTAPDAVEREEEDFGCDWCRMDGRLNDTGHCPKCDAWYPEEDDALPTKENPHVD